MLRFVSHHVICAALCGIGFATHLVRAQGTNFTRLSLEWATDGLGPWAVVPDQNREITDGGEILLTSDSSQRLVRLGGAMMQNGVSGIGARMPITQAPSSTVARARKFIADWEGVPDPDNRIPDADGDSWAHAQLSPYAIKVYDPSYRGGSEPAYLEFKVIADPDSPNLVTNIFGRPGEAALEKDLGYVLVSLHEGDYPQPTFAQRGKTPYEHLLARVPSSSNPRIMRYGDGFSTVEDGAGALLVSFGSAPFRMSPEAVGLAGQTFSGEFDSDTAVTNLLEGQGGPPLGISFYANYDEFKRDYVTNQIVQMLRDARSKSAAIEWQIEKEVPVVEPDVWVVSAGDRLIKLSGETVTRVFLDDDAHESNAKIATFVFGGDRAGLQITGVVTGGAPVTVQTSAGVTSYFLRVVDPGRTVSPSGGPGIAAFTPGWQPWKTWYASPDGYGGMAKYNQPKSDDWCDLLGCGPVAWAVLIHWWEYHGVPAAFYNPDYPNTLYSVMIYSKLGEYDNLSSPLHDYCDVICNPFGCDGATEPSDMIEGGTDWFWYPKLTGAMNYTYSWAWDIWDTDWNEPANRIRTAIKNQRPAIVGLGWLWHYGVAYGYRVREFKSTENGPAIVTQRRFKVNEGWGKDNGAWYHAETFLGASIKAKQLVYPPSS